MGRSELGAQRLILCDRKGFKFALIWFAGHAHLSYRGMGRALVTPLDRSLDIFFRAFKDGFYPPIWEISYPAGKMILPGHTERLGAEEDSLDPAFYKNMSTYIHNAALQETIGQKLCAFSLAILCSEGLPKTHYNTIIILSIK
jgi:hypothetical protein